MKIRLHQYLSRTGIFKSKKDIMNAVKSGEVKIEDKVITNQHYQFNVRRKVTWKENKLKLKKNDVYILLNKPQGYLSSRLTKNDEGKKSVFQLVGDDKTLFCAGRLDEDTTGLLVITNDGKLSHRLTNPGKGIKKTYEAVLEKPVSRTDEIERGVTIILEENNIESEYKTKPCHIKKIDSFTVQITLSEGKKREVRRIFEAVGNKVKKLRRISIGNLSLEKLGIASGAYLKVDKKFIEANL